MIDHKPLYIYIYIHCRHIQLMTHVVYINVIICTCTMYEWRNLIYNLYGSPIFECQLINRWSSLRSPSWSRSKGLADTKGNGSFSNLFEAMHVVVNTRAPCSWGWETIKKTRWHQHFHVCMCYYYSLFYCLWNETTPSWLEDAWTMALTYYL